MLHVQRMHVVRRFVTQNLQFLYIVEQNLQNISIYIYNTDAMITNDPVTVDASRYMNTIFHDETTA